MKVRYLVMAGSLLLAMVLSACGSAFPSVTPASTEPFGTKTAEGTTLPSGTKTAEGTEAPTELPGATGTTTPGAIPVTGGKNPALLSVMMHMCVFDKDGNQIGKANDLILDLDSLRVAFVVVGTGGFLGMGEKNVAVPYNKLQLNTAPGGAGCDFSFVLNADVNAFKNAKEVNLDQDLPPIGVPADPNWQGKFLEFWDNTGGVSGTPVATDTPAAATATPSSGTAQGGKLHGVALASTLLGLTFTLQGQPDTQVAIADAVVETKSGNLLYVVIHTNLADNEVCIPVAFSALSLDAGSMGLILNIDAEALQQAPAFADCQFPDMSSSNWDADIKSFWQSHTNP